MTISDEVLLTWVIAFRVNLRGEDDDDPDGAGLFMIPPDIKKALVAKGWAKMTPDGEDGVDIMQITELGAMKSDIFAPECGVPVFAE